MTLPAYLRRALARLARRVTGWPPCPWCGVEHDPRTHYPLHDDNYGD